MGWPPIVFSGKFRWTMERVDLALMNVYYISAQATLGFEVTSFPVLRDSSWLPVRSALALFRVPRSFSLIRANADAGGDQRRSNRRNRMEIFPPVS